MRWKSFDFEGSFFVFSTETSLLLEVDESLFQKVSSNPNESTPELDEVIRQNTLPDLIHSQPRRHQSVALNVAQGCNLSCQYCFAGQQGDYGLQAKMDSVTAKKTIDFFLKRADDLAIRFFGGEPLLNFELIQDVVSYCKAQDSQKTFQYSMTTNGTLLRSRHLELISENDFSVTVSYDGPTLQPMQRGASPNLIKRIQYWQARFPKSRIRLRMTFSLVNLDVFFQDLEEVLKTCSFPVAFAKVSDGLDESGGRAEIGRKFQEKLLELVKGLLLSGSMADVFRLVPIKEHLKSIHQGKKLASYCGAGKSYVSVSSEGDFYTCHRFTREKDHLLGGIGTQKIAERNFSFTKDKSRPCYTCWMRNLCGGGCVHEHSQAPQSINEEFCNFQEAELNVAFWAYLYVKNHRPEWLEFLD